MRKFRLRTRSSEEFAKVLDELLASGFCFGTGRNKNPRSIKDTAGGTYLNFIFGYYKSCIMQFELCSDEYSGLPAYRSVSSVTELIALIG